MTRFERLIQKMIGSTKTLHILFCFVFILLFFLPVITSPAPSEIIVKAIVICLFFMLALYAGRFVTKSWLLKNKLVLFMFSAAVTIVLFSAMMLTLLYTSGQKSPVQALSLGVPLVILFFSLGIFLTMTSTTLRRQIRTAEIDRIQKQSELELLRSQLSPHFLFNTLHNLYGLSVTEPSAIPPLLIKLADLLRYSVYETRKEFVLLQDELAYIYNYIDLEKIRLGDRLECVADINMNNYKDVKIAPLILITFIENAFKHAKDSVEEKIYIAISLNINQGEICFTILNSHRDQVTQKKGISEASGQGLPNTIRRLDLLYPNKYSLFQQKELNMYRVELKLKNA